jgi:hypothetical protein
MDALELPQPAPKRLNAFWDSLNESDKPWLLISSEITSTILNDCGLEISTTTTKTYRRTVLQFAGS